MDCSGKKFKQERVSFPLKPDKYLQALEKDIHFFRFS